MSNKVWTTNINDIIDYIVDNGIEEGEVNHLLHQKIFRNKSIMDFVAEKDWNSAWYYITQYIEGGTW